MFTTTTLGEILARTKAPHSIRFVGLDIEGAELEALKGLSIDRYSVGASPSNTTTKSPSVARSTR